MSNPTQPSFPPRPKVAVIGAGISGMGAAYDLRDSCDVTLFEAEPRLGGHARTKLAGKRGDQPVDTGFIVFNYANYPNMVRLFEELDVPVVKSDMSFGASIDGGRLEYGLRSLNTVFAQRKNIVNPKFLRMVRDIMRFNAYALGASKDTDKTLADLMDDMNLSDWFRDYYILPLSGAIWSTPTAKIMDFPAHALLTFFQNHALLHHKNQHQWYTVDGGSIQYVSRLEGALRRAGVTIRLKSPIAQVTRTPAGCRVQAVGAEAEQFDHVIFAVHTDQAHSLLSDPSPQEAKALSQFEYQENSITLHADPIVMPKRKSCWASWVYTEEKGHQDTPIDLSYWMNSLQPIPHDDPMFVSLNSALPIKEELIYDQVTLHHPVYDHNALATQKTIAGLNGQNATWYCGAWMKNGFHEDGLSSALDVTRALKAQIAIQPAAAE